MKNRQIFLPSLIFLASILTTVFLLIHRSPTDKILPGRLTGIHLVILIFPLIISMLCILRIFEHKLRNKFKEKIELLFSFFENHFVLELFVFLLLVDVLLVISLPKYSIWLTISQKMYLDVLLVMFIFVAFGIKRNIALFTASIKKIRGMKKFPIIAMTGIFFLILINLKTTGLSAVLFPKKYYGAGAPIVEIQGYIAIITGLLMFLLLRIFQPKQKRLALVDACIVIFLTSIAFFYWNSTKIPTNFFMRFIDPNTIAPYSDSRVYDLNGLGLAYGQGIGFGFPTQKPFYSYFIGMMHLIFANDYGKIITAQLILFSFLPALFFLISKQLSNRAVGLAGAILLIFNEYNLSILSSIYTMNSVKMIMSDTFYSWFIFLLIYITLKWIKEPGNKTLAVFTGLILALCTLIRIQMLAIILLYLIGIIISFRIKKVNLINALVFLTMGLSIGLLPWMVRNYIRTGKLAIEQPEYVNFAFIPTPSFVHSSEENFKTDKEFLQLISTDIPSYLSSASSHFNNSLLSSFYQIPADYGHYYNLSETISVSGHSYPYPYENLTGKQKIIWYANLLVLIFGVIVSWTEFKWRGLFPFIFYLCFTAMISISGYSGWRFVHPVDWIVLLYWTIGVFGLIRLLVSDFSFTDDHNDSFSKNAEMRQKGLLLAIFFALLFGLSMPVTELLIPSAFYVEKKSEVFSRIESSIDFSGTKVTTFIEDPNSIFETGINYYPTVMFPNDNLEWKLRVGFAPYPAYYTKHIDYTDDRIVNNLLNDNGLLFLTLVNNRVQEVYMFNLESEVHLNNGDNISIIGCDRGDFIEAFWIKSNDLIVKSKEGIPANCETN